MQTFMVPALSDFQTYFHEYTANILHRYLYPKSQYDSIDKPRTQHNNTPRTKEQHNNTHNSLFAWREYKLSAKLDCRQVQSILNYWNILL